MTRAVHRRKSDHFSLKAESTSVKSAINFISPSGVGLSYSERNQDRTRDVGGGGALWESAVSTEITGGCPSDMDQHPNQ
jgi:hypothetical protein